MHHFIFPTQDTWISSGSSTITGESFRDQNFGKDQILEVKKEFFNDSFNHQTRALINFDGVGFNELKSEIDRNNITNPRFYLRLYEAEGNAEISSTYDLTANPLYQAWVEGNGKFENNPKTTDGCSWENSANPFGGSAITWSFDNTVTFDDFHSLFITAQSEFGGVSGSDYLGGDSDANGGVWIEDLGFQASQSFNLQSPDVEMDVSSIVNKWLDSEIANYGFIVKFSGSQETDTATFGHLKFFSRNTHTIYSPRLEIRWDDSIFDNNATASLNELTMSGLADNFLYMRGLRDEYREGERVKFRIGARKRYIQKTFTNSVQTVSSSYIPEGKGFYAIKDIATDEFVVPFSEYTSMSLDEGGMYFNQWLDGFYPDRAYKIQLKLNYDDGQEQIFDDDFEFVVKRK